MRRRVLPILASLSLLLCIAAIAMWGRSPQTADWVTRWRGHMTYSVISTRGYVCFTGTRYPEHEFASPLRWFTTEAMHIPGSSDAFLGFGWIDGPNSPQSTQWQLLIPDWFVVALTGTLPACWLVPLARRRWYRRYRSEHGLCLHCGYDLTGNASGVCPECGTPVATQLGAGTQTAPKDPRV